MAFIRTGEQVEVIDTITADQIEEGDQILLNGVDPVEVDKKLDSGDSILIRGYSHLNGDNETYILSADVEVELWTA